MCEHCEERHATLRLDNMLLCAPCLDALKRGALKEFREMRGEEAEVVFSWMVEELNAS